MTTWEMMKQKTIRDVQADVGFIKNRENGIIEQAVSQSLLSEILQPYARPADFYLTFNLGYRSILDMYVFEKQILSDDIITSISVAIDAQAYNLNTILGTLSIEYNPLENIGITEQVITTATISATQIYDKVSISKNIGTITQSRTDTFDGGNRQQINDETQTLGETNRAINSNITNGAQENSETTTLTHAPYNVSDYQPKDKTNVNSDIGQKIDTEITTDKADAVENNTKTTINSTSYKDVRTIEDTTEPYKNETVTNERNDKEDRNNNENKNRTLTGLQGIAPQDLIIKQRELANVSILKCLCEIVINTIANGFINAY